jgi:hypothetical protein
MNRAEFLIRELVTPQRFVQCSTVREANACFTLAKIRLMFARTKITDVLRVFMFKYHIMPVVLNPWLTNTNTQNAGVG